jgi:nucleoid-associated protein YgaU
MGLREKYAHAVQTAKNLRFDGSAQEQDGRLYFRGTASSQEDANKIWDAIKTIPDWRKEIQADITVKPGATGTGAAEKTYTVKPGDTLSKIAREHLGDANAYPRIFDANRDQLTDPDQIRPGQVLKIPASSGATR